MKRLVIFLVLLINSFVVTAQQIFYQDTYRGGVTGGGYASTLGSGIGSFTLQIPSGSTIRYAFLIAGCQGKPKPVKILLNSVPYYFNQNNQISTTFLSLAYDSIASVHAINLTNNISPLITNYTISVPAQYNSPVSARYTEFYLIVGYKKLSFPLVNSVIEINNQNFTPNIQYEIKNINPIDLVSQVGFAIMTGFFCDTLTDGSYIKINGFGN